jgi:hypothetical protein
MHRVALSTEPAKRRRLRGTLIGVYESNRGETLRVLALAARQPETPNVSRLKGVEPLTARVTAGGRRLSLEERSVAGDA